MRGAVGTIGEGVIERLPSTRGRRVGGVVAGPGPELRGLDVRGWLVSNAAHHTRDHENSDDRTCFYHAGELPRSIVFRQLQRSSIDSQSVVDGTSGCGSRLLSGA